MLRQKTDELNEVCQELHRKNDMLQEDTTVCTQIMMLKSLCAYVIDMDICMFLQEK